MEAWFAADADMISLKTWDQASALYNMKDIKFSSASTLQRPVLLCFIHDLYLQRIIGVDYCRYSE